MSAVSYAVPLTKDNTDKSKLPNLYRIKNPRVPKNNPNAESSTRIIIGGGRNARIMPPSLVVGWDMMDAAQKILKNNRPAFTKNYEVKNFMGNRGVKAKFTAKVCAKNKTIAAGFAGIEFDGIRIDRDDENLNNQPFMMITSDPEYTFKGQIKVGLKMSGVKSFLKSELDGNDFQVQVQDNPGHLSFKTENMSVDFLYENDIITQISYHQPNYTHYNISNIQAALKFINSQAAKMGLRNLY